MAPDDSCYIRENMQDQLLPLVQQYKPPFHFDFGTLEDEDEEGGNAWVF